MREGSTDLLEEARRLDPERAIALLFAEPADRPLLTALVLFNAELARIPELAREPMAGMIRYQWWRERLEAIKAGASAAEHPLLPVLARGIDEGRVVPKALATLIDAREAELDRLQPADLDQLDAYAGATSGRLHGLLARACAADDRTARAAFEVGTGHALIGLVRAVGFHQAQGRLLLPVELLDQEQVSADEVLDPRNAEALGRVTAAVLARAERALQDAAAAGPFPRRVMPALLTARLARRHVRALRRQRGQPLEVAACGALRGLSTVPDLVWHWLIRRI